MDGSTANLSQTAPRPWTGQNVWSTAPGPLYNSLSHFQNLSLGSDQSSFCGYQQPSHQSPLPSHHHTQGYQQNNGMISPTDYTPCKASHVSLSPTSSVATNQSLHVSFSVTNHGHNIPPPSLPIANQGPQSCKPQPMSPLPPYSAQPPFTQQGVFNGPPSPQNAFGNADMSGLPLGPASPADSSGYKPSHISCATPIQQQPQWPPSPHCGGPTEESVDGCASRDPPLKGNTMPAFPSSESRYGLDTKLLPSAVKVMEEDRAQWGGKVFISEPGSSIPPLATTSCLIEDRGNASPSAIRSTTYCVPCEGQSALLSRLPLGALITPLATDIPGEKSLPICSEPDCVRGCEECAASMCPAMGWQDCGQRFCCPFCNKVSEVPWQHYQPTIGVEGVRLDRDKRPELSNGSYEILHSEKGEPAVLVLAIDVSSSALQGGHLDFVTKQIHIVLSSLNRQDGASQSDIRVGLMTYDSRIHLYNLSPALSRPHMLVVTETEDLELPVRAGLLVPLRDCIDSIGSVLQVIPNFSPEGDNSGGGPIELPVKAGLAVLQAMGCPGKLLLFHNAPLTEASLTHSSGFFGSSKPKPPEHAVSFAKQCVNQGCGVHLFALSQQDVGGAWPGHVPYLSGGALYTYSHLQGELDRERFSTDLKRTVETETGYKAHITISISRDLRVSGCYGIFIPGPRPSHVSLATMDWRTTLAVEFSHSRALEEKRAVVIQVSVTYSSQSGDRRTRVHTLSIRSSRPLLDTFRHCQAQTLLTFYCKKMYCKALELPLQELREELQTDVTELLASYRKHCSSTAVSAGQLVLPQYLRALPVYINSLRKSEVLLPGLRSSIHQRLQLWCQVLHMDTRATATHFYPLLLPLPLSVDETSGANLPSPAEALRCSAASLDPRGLYLVSGPLALLLWVGSNVPAHALVQLFNASGFSSVPSGETKLPALENPLSTSVRSFIEALNAQAPYTRNLWVVRQGDSCEEAMQRHLVEDKSPNGGASYADFLYHVHINSVRLLQ